VQTQGDLSSTGNLSRFAIQGSGFFQILMPNGNRLQRSGSFQPDAQATWLRKRNALQPAINIPAAATNNHGGQRWNRECHVARQTQANKWA